MIQIKKVLNLPASKKLIHDFGRRYYGIVGDTAARVISNKVKDIAMDVIQKDISQNSTIWLSPHSVDDPTISILDPEPILNLSSLDSNRINSSILMDFNTISTYPDPYQLVEKDINSITKSIRNILGTDHPVLSAVAKYFFETDGGKKIRPTMVILLSKAANQHDNVSNKWTNAQYDYISNSQQRLAEITEMIHTASLLHDDVIDKADTRRGIPSTNAKFGDKLSILAGDFLLARSSICLARLRSLQVIELMSTAIEHLVKGEVMQMRMISYHQSITPFEYYLRKNYYKTGSLMANSCRSGLVLGEHSESICKIGYAFGRHIGLAFQLIDDYLDYQGVQTGKPTLADLKSGLVTAPVFLAQQEFPELSILMERKFERDGDVAKAAELVQQSSGLEKTKQLAIEQAVLACDALLLLTPSEERNALIRLTHHVITRTR